MFKKLREVRVEFQFTPKYFTKYMLLDYGEKSSQHILDGVEDIYFLTFEWLNIFASVNIHTDPK